jgi:transcriptional regulator with XRE-family HTH domain
MGVGSRAATKKYRYSERKLRRRISVVKENKYRYSELANRKEPFDVSALGDKIRDLRKKKGYTLEKLAELTESSKSYIWELENKNPRRPSGEKIGKIASVLGVTAEYLLDPTEKVQVADATDEAFYRKYRRMDPTTKHRIRRMVDLWGDDRADDK